MKSKIRRHLDEKALEEERSDDGYFGLSGDNEQFLAFLNKLDNNCKYSVKAEVVSEYVTVPDTTHKSSTTNETAQKRPPLPADASQQDTPLKRQKLGVDGSSASTTPYYKPDKAIEQLDYATGTRVLKRYASGTEAASSMQISQSGISLCCSGLKADAYGYRWRFCSGSFIHILPLIVVHLIIFLLSGRKFCD